SSRSGAEWAGERVTTSNRHGCAAAATVAASSTALTGVVRCPGRSSTTAIRVNTSPLVTPSLRRAAASSRTTSAPVVSHSAATATLRSAPSLRCVDLPLPASRRQRSRAPPGPAVAGEQLIGAARTPFAGPVRLRLGACPRLLQRVDHPPALFHLVGVGEQGAVADQHVPH